MLNYSNTAEAFKVYDQKYQDFHDAVDTSGDILTALADLSEAAVGLGLAFSVDSEPVNNSVRDCIKTAKSISGRDWLRKRVDNWEQKQETLTSCLRGKITPEQEAALKKANTGRINVV